MGVLPMSRIGHGRGARATTSYTLQTTDPIRSDPYQAHGSNSAAPHRMSGTRAEPRRSQRTSAATSRPHEPFGPDPLPDPLQGALMVQHASSLDPGFDPERKNKSFLIRPKGEFLGRVGGRYRRSRRLSRAKPGTAIGRMHVSYCEGRGSSHDPRSMDWAEVGPWRQALGEGVADAAAERVDQGRIQQAPARVLPAPRPAT